MPFLNKTLLMGNLTRDPEVRFTPSGTPVGTLRLAINRAYNAANGERREDVLFVDVVAWGKQAEHCAQYLAKGSPVLIEGRLQSREWEARDGSTRTAMEVVAERVQFLTRKGSSESPAPAHTPAEALAGVGATDELPF